MRFAANTASARRRTTHARASPRACGPTSSSASRSQAFSSGSKALSSARKVVGLCAQQFLLGAQGLGLGVQSAMLGAQGCGLGAQAFLLRAQASWASHARPGALAARRWALRARLFALRPELCALQSGFAPWLATLPWWPQPAVAARAATAWRLSELCHLAGVSMRATATGAGMWQAFQVAAPGCCTLRPAPRPLKKLNLRQVIDSYRAAQRQGKSWKGYALPFSISSLRKQGGAPRWSRCRSSFSETGCPNGLTNVGCETNNQANCRANYVHQWLVGLCGALSLCHTRQSFMHKDHGRQPVWVPNWSVKRTPTQAMPSAFSWPVLVPSAFGSGAG